MLLLLLIFQTLGESLSQMAEYELKAPASVTVQEGLCIQVPCSFSYPLPKNPYGFQALGYWYKNKVRTDGGKVVATNDPNREVQEEARGRFHLIGDPLKNNCSLSITEAHKRDSGQYFFRIQRGQTVKFNYLNYMVNVSVEALTEKPDIYILGTLEAGKLVKVICMVPSISGCGTAPLFSWTGAILSSQEFIRETLYFSELTLFPRPQDHGSNLTCQVTLPGSRVSTERTVHFSITHKKSTLMFFKGLLLGAGIMAFLALCLILALLKFLRKKQVEDSEPQESKKMDYIHQISEGVSSDQHRDPRLPLPDLATQAPSEIHYASLNFRRISS